jgi:glycosyltransferase involved in cell wall biosynthesis
MARFRLVFLALHLITERLSSGGDVVFANLARSIGEDPEWATAVIAPSFAAEHLSEYSTVIPVTASRDEPAKLAAAPAKIPFAWYRRVASGLRAAQAYNPTVVYATGDFFPNILVGSRLRQSLNRPFAGVVHHVNEHPLVRRNNFARSVISYELQRFSLRRLRGSADALFVDNSAVRKFLIDFGFKPERVHAVGNAIDTSTFPLIDCPSGTKNVLWLHRLEPTKGVMDIGPILERLPSGVTIDIAGSGPTEWQERLRTDLSRRSLLGRARIHGYVDDEKLKSLLESAAAFISCSYEEGWGISISEALASGIPCVAYDLPSTTEVFQGFVKTVPKGDTAAFAQAITATLAAGDSYDERLARRAFIERYSYESLAAREKGILRSLIG